MNEGRPGGRSPQLQSSRAPRTVADKAEPDPESKRLTEDPLNIARRSPVRGSARSGADAREDCPSPAALEPMARSLPTALRRRHRRFLRANHLLGRVADRRQHPGRGFDILEWQVMLVGIALLGLRAESIAAQSRESSRSSRARASSTAARRVSTSIRAVSAAGCPRRFVGTGGAHRLDLKAFGDCIAARDPDRQTAEIRIRVLRGGV